MRRVAAPCMSLEASTPQPSSTGVQNDSPNKHGKSAFTSPATSPHHPQSGKAALSSGTGTALHSRTHPGSAAQQRAAHGTGRSGQRKGGGGQHSSANASSDTNIFLRHLPLTVDDAMLRAVFASFGEITSASVMRNIHTGESLGTAFVRFERSTDAKAAFTHFKNTGRYISAEGTVMEKPRAGAGEAGASSTGSSATPSRARLTVQWARRQHDEAIVGEKRTQVRKLFIRNIPVDVTETQLREMFEAYGPVEHVTLHADTAASNTGPNTPAKRAAAARKAKAAAAAAITNTATTTTTNTVTTASGTASHTTTTDAHTAGDTDEDDLTAIEVSDRSSDGRLTAATVAAAHDAVTTDARLIAFITFSEDGCAAAACDAVHCTTPFPHCNGVSLMAKLAEDTRQRTARRTACATITPCAPALSPLAMPQGHSARSPVYGSGPRLKSPSPLQAPIPSTTLMLTAVPPASGMAPPHLRSEGAEGGEVAMLYSPSVFNAGVGYAAAPVQGETMPQLPMAARRGQGRPWGAPPLCMASLNDPISPPSPPYPARIPTPSPFGQQPSHAEGGLIAMGGIGMGVEPRPYANLGSQTNMPLPSPPGGAAARRRYAQGLTLNVPTVPGAPTIATPVPAVPGGGSVPYGQLPPPPVTVSGAVVYPSSSSVCGGVPVKLPGGGPCAVVVGAHGVGDGGQPFAPTNGRVLLQPVFMTAVSGLAGAGEVGRTMGSPALAPASPSATLSPSRTFRHNPYGCLLTQPLPSSSTSPVVTPCPHGLELNSTAHSVQG